MRYFGLFLCLLMFGGCSVGYNLHYETEVLDYAGKAEADSQLVFSLEPIYNGIVFKIDNRSDETARIIWDHSYFITPDGNSFKALNTDLLEEEGEISRKAEYVSIIPPRASFTRFTTATTLASKMTYRTVSNFYSRWSGSSSILSVTSVDPFVRYGNYWPITVKAQGTGEKVNRKVMDYVEDFVEENNRLGLGLSVEHGGREKEYRFDVKIKTVDLIAKERLRSDDGSDRKVRQYVLKYTYDPESGEWKEVNLPLLSKGGS